MTPEELRAREAQTVAEFAQRPRRWLESFCRDVLSGPGTEWRTVRLLVRAGLVARPRTVSYTTLMPQALSEYHGLWPTLRDELLADPGLLQDEVFDLFTVDGAAIALQTADNWAEDGRDHPEWSWRVTLARLAADGHADRSRLLDACLGAFFRDFPPGQLAWYVRFHAQLAPDAGELAERCGSYLRLLAADAGTAVGIGQKAIATLLTQGQVDPAEIVKASGPVLARPEKKYPAAQLRLLDVVARRREDLAEAAVDAAAVAFEHPRTDIQEQALGLAGRHDRQTGLAARERVRTAAASVAPSLLERAQAVLGRSDVGPQTTAVAVTSAAATVTAAAALKRVTGLAGLTGAAAALAADPWNPALTEQVIDGIARLAADRTACREALKPLARRLEDQRVAARSVALLALTAILKDVGPPRDTRKRRWAGWRRAGGSGPLTLVASRIVEACTRSGDGQARPLLAYPDTAAGHVDPERIVATVAAMEDAGTQPWPADFAQALLRLPRDSFQNVIPPATRLRSPAGRALADVLRRGAVPDPLTELTRERDGSLVAASYVPVVTSAPLLSPVTMRIDRAAQRPADPVADIWELKKYWWSSVWAARELLIWAHALPSHREVAAAHALFVICGMDKVPDRMRPDGQFVAHLPDMQGPAGPAVALTLAHFLSAHDAQHRAAAVEALTGFGRPSGRAGRDGELDGGLVGRILVEMKNTRVGRIAECLQSAAADPGARVLAWQIASAAIPGLLGSGARDTHRLLSVAADLAAATGMHAHIDGLAEAAARSGSSRLTAEARRLHALL
jgi:Family of unknown function (DUF6493)